MTVRLVLATLNPHKVTELSRILDGDGGPGAGVSLTSLAEFPGAPDVAETGATFADNALLKARAIAAFTGLPAVADDSGICADALNGMPGVLSARWSGRHGDDQANLDLLLAQLADIPDERRGAEFRCAAALVQPGGAEQVTEGVLRGRADPGPARHRRVRLRPDLRPRRRHADHRRAEPGGEGRDQPPRPRLPCPGPGDRSPARLAGPRSHSGP